MSNKEEPGGARKEGSVEKSCEIEEQQQEVRDASELGGGEGAGTSLSLERGGLSAIAEECV